MKVDNQFVVVILPKGQAKGGIYSFENTHKDANDKAIEAQGECPESTIAIYRGLARVEPMVVPFSDEGK